jgi:beta-lactamase superfamily II metal-dependent hydrolase
MKVRIFPSDKGDCLLLAGHSKGKILCDGGMQESFNEFVAEQLASEGPLDLVYVSHVDDDHIAGILKLLDNAWAWRIFQHHRDEGDEDVREPNVPKAPAIKRIWHNAFRAQVDNAGEVEDLLAAMVPMLSQVDDVELQQAAAENFSIVNSNAQAIRVSQRVGADQLGIPLNEDDKLMLVRDGQGAFKFGDLSVHLIAPFAEDVQKFRDEWNEWLKANKEKVKELKNRARKDARDIDNELDRLVMPVVASATELGDRSAVTPPNLASIMLFVEDGQRTALMTGDGHADDVIKGLNSIRRLARDGSLHVDVLKVQHHGSEHNMTEEFARRITADHYVFCGNGFSGNPEPIVIDALFKARVEDGAGPNKNFKFWFNSSKAMASGKADRARHMGKIERQVSDLMNQSNRFKSFFLQDGDHFDITLA